MILVTVLLAGIVGDSVHVVSEIASDGPETQTTIKAKHHQIIISGAVLFLAN